MNSTIQGHRVDEFYSIVCTRTVRSQCNGHSPCHSPLTTSSTTRTLPVSLVTFGCCINPCSKDQDRLDFRKIQGNGEVIYCAALYDGHGVSATVADLAQDNMLAHIEAELQKISFNDLSEKVKTQVASALCMQCNVFVHACLYPVKNSRNRTYQCACVCLLG